MVASQPVGTPLVGVLVYGILWVSSILGRVFLLTGNAE